MRLSELTPSPARKLCGPGWRGRAGGRRLRGLVSWDRQRAGGRDRDTNDATHRQRHRHDLVRLVPLSRRTLHSLLSLAPATRTLARPTPPRASSCTTGTSTTPAPAPASYRHAPSLPDGRAICCISVCIIPNAAPLVYGVRGRWRRTRVWSAFA
ncbi:hypothetical protein B0H12DRAFT_1143326 [Mycena haematopus]|nr:hypothetical protein B0H12DRAFT_1143326 [Mycena haematopus]